MSKTTDIGYANVESRRKPPLEWFFEQDGYDPDIVVITEAYWCKRHANRVGRKHGYRAHRFGARHGWESRSILWMVKEGTQKRKRLVKLKEPWWWGPRRDRLRQRGPRRMVVSKVQRTAPRALMGHFPPGGPAGAVPRTGGKNKPAWHEGKRRVNRIMRRWQRNGKDGLAIFDFNASPSEVREHFPDFRYVSLSPADGILMTSEWARVKSKRADGKPGHGWSLTRLRRK